MTHTDIYAGDEERNIERSMRYISIRVNNVTGILNRRMSLMRRKRYNMEEVSVTFDRKLNQADIILALDARVNDVNHVIQQIRKLYDVHSVSDITEEAGRVFHVFDVFLKGHDALEQFPQKPEKVVRRKDGEWVIFMIPLKDLAEFTSFLKSGGYPYGERIIGLI